MPARAKVLIHYGPYESCGVVEHRDARLLGLQNVLKTDGHSCQLVEIDDRNAVEIWVNGEMIYNCDIRDLDYSGDGILDPLCKDTLLAVKKAF